MKILRPNPALLTDLYELTMAASYYDQKMTAPATFSLFIRDYSKHRSYFVNVGLEDVVEYLEGFHFTADDLAWLNSTGFFSDAFVHYLSTVRFTGDLFAMPEGRIFFRNEPVLEVTAPIIEAQLVETFIMNTLNVQVAVATKAARCVLAAGARQLIDFSLRRTQGGDAGLKAAKASYLAGFMGTSNVLAGKMYGIPMYGTMAHSYIESFESEQQAFRAYALTFPQNSVFLIDTYDTMRGAENAVIVGRQMQAGNMTVKGVRLDSGNIALLSRKVRTAMRKAGLSDAKIFASGSLDEYEIEKIIGKGGEVDVFAVGTKMGVSADAPYTDMAYKLVEYDGRPVLKLSRNKQSLTSCKQVFRVSDGKKIVGDTIALRSEKLNGEPLLAPVMKNGRRLTAGASLEAIRHALREELVLLGDEHKRLKNPVLLPVRVSERLSELQLTTARRARARERVDFKLKGRGFCDGKR